MSLRNSVEGERGLDGGFSKRLPSVGLIAGSMIYFIISVGWGVKFP
jgi:hypothetical protein